MHVKELVIPEHIESASAKQVLEWSLETFQPRLGLCTSFAAEGVVLIDMLTKLTNRVRVFTLDTGRLMPETYAVIEAIRERYDLEIEVFACVSGVDLAAHAPDRLPGKVRDHNRAIPVITDENAPIAQFPHPSDMGEVMGQDRCGCAERSNPLSVERAGDRCKEAAK